MLAAGVIKMSGYGMGWSVLEKYSDSERTRNARQKWVMARCALVIVSGSVTK